MAKCSCCGKRGLFLRIDSTTGFCIECSKNREAESNVRESRFINSERTIENKQKVVPHIEDELQKEQERLHINLMERERAIRLYDDMKKKATLANKTTDYEEFMVLFEDILSNLYQLAEIEKRNPNISTNGSFQEEYRRKLSEKQWHMRDAIEREYLFISKSAKGKYRNYKSMVLSLCEHLLNSIEEYRDIYDEETTAFVDGITRKISIQYGVETNKYSDESILLEENFDALEGYEFERWCAELLLANGFESATVTQGSGDQGVDIIAKKDDISYAIQCKCYSSDLGNTPIQEIVAGKAFYKCQIGVVMTNRYFTKSAIALADATGTLLWDRNKILAMMRKYKAVKQSVESNNSENEIVVHNNTDPSIYLNEKGKEVSNGVGIHDIKLIKVAYNSEKRQAVEQINTSLFCDDENLIGDNMTEMRQNESLKNNSVFRFDIPGKNLLPKQKHMKELKSARDMLTTYNYPPIDVLARGEMEDTSAHVQSDMQKAKQLDKVLQSFGISTKLTGIAHGPAVTRFELQTVSEKDYGKISIFEEQICNGLSDKPIRIMMPMPYKNVVGVEIPNDKVEMVRLRDVLESPDARKHPSRIAVGLGKDNSGRYIVADIAKMPHVLIAGQTGSGKSVCINAIIASILFRASPEEVRLILIDPKVVELSIYNNIPHLVCPVVTDPKKAASALDWAVAEMTKRYKMFAEKGVRDIKGYNKALKDGEKMMPQMVIIIDELADLMMVSPGEVEDSICRLAQHGSDCGMYLVIATQRPSVNVITGNIKANIPTRIAFSMASQVDSRTMIDHGGAEKLLGNGDMLFVPNGMKSMRVQGAWVSDDEIHAIVKYIKQSNKANYNADMLGHMKNTSCTDAEKEEFDAEYDPKLPEAIDIAIDLGQVSISILQRKMRIGYARAGRIIDEMSRRGIVSEADGSKPRDVLITREMAKEMFED